MVQHTNPELTDMVLIYGEVFSNAEATRRLYNTWTCTQSLNSLCTYFCEYCPGFKGNRGRSRFRRVLDLEPEILQAVEEELNVSWRRLVLRMGVSSFTIWTTLHEQGLHRIIFNVSDA
jgi:DNA repair photolyase